jgi:predicted nucleic acid-binding Zn ribbon protein
MPTYEYETISADPSKIMRFEFSQRMADAPLTKHPETGEPVRRVISGGLGFTGVECRAGGQAAPAGGCGTPHCGHSHH